MSGLPVLTYHAIGTERSPNSTSRAWFVETITKLLDAGFHGVDLNEWVARGRPDEPRGFALAFDDGLRSFLQVAEFLTELGLPASVFLVTDFVGRTNDWPGQPRWIPREPTLSWSNVIDLAAAGFTFAAHGRTHARLDTCGSRILRSELTGSRDAIEQRLGRSCRLLAYPYGRSTTRVEDASAMIFDAAFGTRLDYASSDQHFSQLSRIDAYYLRSTSALNALLEDRWRSWLRVRRALRAVRQRAEETRRLASYTGLGLGAASR